MPDLCHPDRGIGLRAIVPHGTLLRRWSTVGCGCSTSKSFCPLMNWAPIPPRWRLPPRASTCQFGHTLGPTSTMVGLVVARLAQSSAQSRCGPTARPTTRRPSARSAAPKKRSAAEAARRRLVHGGPEKRRRHRRRVPDVCTDGRIARHVPGSGRGQLDVYRPRQTASRRCRQWRR